MWSCKRDSSLISLPVGKHQSTHTLLYCNVLLGQHWNDHNSNRYIMMKNMTVLQHCLLKIISTISIQMEAIHTKIEKPDESANIFHWQKPSGKSRELINSVAIMNTSILIIEMSISGSALWFHLHFKRAVKLAVIVFGIINMCTFVFLRSTINSFWKAFELIYCCD